MAHQDQRANDRTHSEQSGPATRRGLGSNSVIIGTVVVLALIVLSFIFLGDFGGDPATTAIGNDGVVTAPADDGAAAVDGTAAGEAADSGTATAQ